MARGRTNRTAKKRQIVLDAIGRGLTVAEAATEAGMSRRSIFDWREADTEFAREFKAAYSAGTDVYEAEARRRGFEGSDVLLIFLLRQRDPKRFNQKMLVVTGDAERPIAVSSGSPKNVHFYLPMNGRDRPEAIEADEQHIIDAEPDEDTA